MTVHQRLQHAALAISFILLVVTGFMLRYPEAWWVDHSDAEQQRLRRPRIHPPR